MIRKFAVMVAAVASLCGSAFACETTTGPLLAPVDPFAWAAANADWHGYAATQVDSLKKIVNGQIAAHQVNSSYTCSSCRSVMRVKCYDPANCVMCSEGAGATGRKLRAQLNGSISSSADMAAMSSLLSTYSDRQSKALEEQAKWNELRNQYTVEEEVTVDGGESQTTTKKVTVTNAADTEMKKQAAVLQALSQAAYQQGQQQGMSVHAYVGAASGSLQKPQHSTALFSGQDPLK